MWLYYKCSTFVLYYFEPEKELFSSTPLQGNKNLEINRGATEVRIAKKGYYEGRFCRQYQ